MLFPRSVAARLAFEDASGIVPVPANTDFTRQQVGRDRADQIVTARPGGWLWTDPWR
jgi:hypothetical protein